ncbi:MAG: Ig-like domain-containing protein [Candidatus Saliniplasma sp.]
MFRVKEKTPTIISLIISMMILSSFLFSGVLSDLESTSEDFKIEINNPNNGDIWSGSSEQNISWTLNTSLEASEIELTIEYVYNGSGPYTIKSFEKGELPDLSANHTWSVPDIDSDDVSIIIRAEGGLYKRWEMVTISIDSTPPEYLSSNPDDGGSLQSDHPIQITFDEQINLTDFRENFTLFSFNDEIDGVISQKPDDDFTVEFIPFGELTPADNYSFELSGIIKDKSVPGNELEVDETVEFTVKRRPPIVEVSTPIEDRIRIGNTTDINWTVDQLELSEDPITISYSLDQGDTWFKLAEDIEDTGSFTWEVSKEPLTAYPKNDVIVNVSCENKDGLVGYGHSSRFTVYENMKPNLEIERPYEDLVIVQGQETEIRWNASDDITLPDEPITISISIDGGSSWKVISHNVKNDGVYHWDVDTRAEEAIVNISCTDKDDAMSWDHSGRFTILEENPLEVSLDPVEGTYHPRDRVTVEWTSPPMVEDHQSMKVYFSDDGESWGLQDEVEPDDFSTEISLPFAMSSLCKIKIEVVDENGPIYSAESEKFEVIPSAQDITLTELGDSTMIHLSFGSWVSRGLMEDCLVLYRNEERIDIAKNEIYAMSGSEIVIIKDDLPEGEYELSLNSSDSNVEFEDWTLSTFEVGEQNTEDYITYWPVLLLIPITAFLLFIYKIKIDSSDERKKRKSI